MAFGKKQKYQNNREVQHFFRRLALRWERMRRKNKLVLTGVVAAVAVAVVLLVVFVAKPALPPKDGNISLEEQAVQQQEAQATPQPLPTPSPTPRPTPSPTPDPTLLEGMEDPRVTELQTRLMDLGYLDIDETTQYYGPATNYAVQLFQRQHGLEQDGVCGPKTLDIIYTNDAKMYTLLEGTAGNDVDMLQERLRELGYLSKQTGYYGTETIDAVKEFQKRNNIGVDGKTGQVTLDLIYSGDAKPTAELENQVRRRGTIKEFLAAAEAQLGKKYVWGAAGPKTFDCSGLVTYCLRQAGSTTGRLNAAGFSTNSRWEKITSMNNMEIGDLIFFTNNAGTRVGHTGIYVGDGMMIDASSGNGKVVKRSCRSSYWERHFVCARRPW